MDITPVKPLDPFDRHVKFKVPEQVPLEPIVLDADLLRQAEVPYQEITTFEKIRMSVELVPFYFLYLKGKLMKDWKTTLSGVVGAGAVILRMFGVDIPQPVLDGIIAVALFCIGLFSKDKPAEG